MVRNRVCELLGIKYPIIQAPMNWVSGADLVAAISNAGGLGTLGPNSGAKDITSDIELTGKRMRDQIRKVRSHTGTFCRKYCCRIWGGAKILKRSCKCRD